MGEGIRCICKLPAETPTAPEPVQDKPAAGKVDLSAFSSMLKTKWKTGSSTVDAASTKAKDLEPASAGQVRSFRISAIDTESKRITLELLQ